MKVSGTVRLGLAFAGAVLMGAVALAQAPGGGMGPGPGFGDRQPPMEKAFEMGGGHGSWWNNPKAVERLKLTEEQRKTFDGIFLEHREKLIDLRASLQKAELGMDPLIRADQPNEARILAQIDKVVQARGELEKANAVFLLAIRSKLTPEQWKLMQTFRGNHADRHDWKPGEHGPGNWRQGGPRHNAQPPQPPSPGAEPSSGAAPEPPVAPHTEAEQ